MTFNVRHPSLQDRQTLNWKMHTIDKLKFWIIKESWLMTDSSLLEFLGTIIRGVSSERSSFIAEAPSTSYFWINHSIPPTLSTSLMASSVWGVASSMKYAVICRLRKSTNLSIPLRNRNFHSDIHTINCQKYSPPPSLIKSILADTHRKYLTTLIF